MPFKLSSLSSSAAALALGVALFSPAAHAGFQWVAQDAGGSAYVAPSTSGTTTLSTSSVPAARATASPEIISPVVITGDTRAKASPSVAVAPSYLSPASSEGSVTLSSTQAAPVAVAPSRISDVSAPAGKLDLATATISVSPPANDSTAVANDVVQGFASQIPLALALRQLLPVGYSFSIDPSVDMDTLVSYKGGKSWRDTVHGMLVSAGLAEHEQGTTVSVSRGAALAAEAKVTAAVSAPSVPPLPPAQSVKAPPSIGYLTMPAASAAVPSAEVPSAVVGLPDGWDAERGGTLRKVLTDWCHRANAELQWKAEYDYPVEASAHFSSGFEDAVRNLLAGFDGARPQPVGELHRNAGAGQIVLVIQARGNSYTN